MPKDQDCHELWSKRRKRTLYENERREAAATAGALSGSAPATVDTRAASVSSGSEPPLVDTPVGGDTQQLDGKKQLGQQAGQQMLSHQQTGQQQLGQQPGQQLVQQHTGQRAGQQLLGQQQMVQQELEKKVQLLEGGQQLKVEQKQLKSERLKEEAKEEVRGEKGIKEEKGLGRNVFEPDCNSSQSSDSRFGGKSLWSSASLQRVPTLHYISSLLVLG